MDDAESRKQALLYDAWDAVDADMEEEDEDEELFDAPNANNVIQRKEVSPIPALIKIPTRFLPLLHAITEVENQRSKYSKVEWNRIVRTLEMRNVKPPEFRTLTDYLQVAKEETGFVDFSFNEKAKIEFVWTKIPIAWIDPSKGQKRKPPKEVLDSSYIFRGENRINLTEAWVRAILQLSQAPGSAVEAKKFQEACESYGATYIPKIIQMVIKQGLLLEWKDVGGQDALISVTKCTEDQVSGILRASFDKHFPEAQKSKMDLQLLTNKMWDNDPNVFLACHTTDLRKIVEMARKSGDYVKLTNNGYEVSWIE